MIRWSFAKPSRRVGRVETKLKKLKDAAECGDWRKAISIAARFPRLGEHRGAILDAQSAYTNPAFMAQIGRDPDACIRAGMSALIAAYGIRPIKH